MKTKKPAAGGNGTGLPEGDHIAEPTVTETPDIHDLVDTITHIAAIFDAVDGMAEVVANNCHSATERTGLGYGPVQGMMWALNELHTRIIDAERQADALEAAALQAATSGRADA